MNSVHAQAGRTRRTGPARGFAGFAAAVALVAVFCARDAFAEAHRQICVSIEPRYYILDADFFDLGNAFGAGAAVRYEIASDYYLENGFGYFGADANGVSVDGLDYRMNLFAIFPLLIPVPYRPIARLGIGFLSVNPVTATPTDTYRPTQTTFYFFGGAGVTRTLFSTMLVEASANIWVTPYEYRIYRFNRLNVTTDVERFTHLSISLALTYLF